MTKVKPIEKILDANSYVNDRKVIFRIANPEQVPDDPTNSIQISLAIAYRLYHLGRAYDLQTIKLIHPGAMTRIEYVHLPSLTIELEQIFDIVNDPVARHHLQLLLPLLKSKRQNAKSALLVLPQ